MRRGGAGGDPGGAPWSRARTEAEAVGGDQMLVRRSMSPIAMTVMKIMTPSAVIIADVFLLVDRSRSEPGT